MPIYRNFNGSKKDIIFVHIPKTGGSYIKGVLEESVEDSLQVIPNHHWIKEHYTLNEIASFNEIDISRSFIFTLVRNPMNKLLSTYNFFKNCKRMFPRFIEYLNFVENVVENRFYLDPHYVVDYFSRYGIDVNHFRPQAEFVNSRDLKIKYFNLENELDEFVVKMRDDFSIDLSQLRFNRNYLTDLNPSQIARIKSLYSMDFDAFLF